MLISEPARPMSRRYVDRQEASSLAVVSDSDEGMSGSESADQVAARIRQNTGEYIRLLK
jgi:hypothetical protein